MGSPRPNSGKQPLCASGLTFELTHSNTPVCLSLTGRVTGRGFVAQLKLWPLYFCMSVVNFSQCLPPPFAFSLHPSLRPSSQIRLQNTLAQSQSQTQPSPAAAAPAYFKLDVDLLQNNLEPWPEMPELVQFNLDDLMEPISIPEPK